MARTYFVGQSIRETHRILIVGSFPKQMCDIRWSRRPWPILEAPEICFHLVQIDLDLDLMGKGNINLGKVGDGFRSAKYHDSGT